MPSDDPDTVGAGSALTVGAAGLGLADDWWLVVPLREVRELPDCLLAAEDPVVGVVLVAAAEAAVVLVLALFLLEPQAATVTVSAMIAAAGTVRAAQRPDRQAR